MSNSITDGLKKQKFMDKEPLSETLAKEKQREASRKCNARRRSMRDDLKNWIDHYNQFLPGQAVYEFYGIVNHKNTKV